MNPSVSLINLYIGSRTHHSFAHGFRSDPIGFVGGEYLPLPARPTLRVCARGWLSPFLLTSMGAPLLPANLRSEIMGSTQKSGNSD